MPLTWFVTCHNYCFVNINIKHILGFLFVFFYYHGPFVLYLLFLLSLKSVILTPFFIAGLRFVEFSRLEFFELLFRLCWCQFNWNKFMILCILFIKINLKILLLFTDKGEKIRFINNFFSRKRKTAYFIWLRVNISIWRQLCGSSFITN